VNRGVIVIEEHLRIPADVFPMERFRDWAHSPEFPQSGRLSYIGGQVDVGVGPEEIETHNKPKVCLTVGITIWVQRRNLGEMLADRAFLVNEDADLATEPDLTFSSWDALRSGRVRYAERVKGSRRLVEVIGSPDLVVEVVSDNSVHKDTVLLVDRYWRAKISEYWLVDARGESIEFKILASGSRGYVEAPSEPDGYRGSDVLEGAFLITRDLNPVGGYRYRLLHREIS